MGKIRAFVAVELAEPLQEALARVQRRLKGDVHLPVRWVEPHGVHLTLKFLGGVEEESIPAIEEGLARAADTVGPISIALGHIGGFPSLSRPRVIWVGLEGEVEALARLQQRVEREMEALHFPREERPFEPHLTLGRVRQGGGRGAPLAPAWAGIEEAPGPPQTVEGISLMRSDLRPTGAVHTRLASFPLQ